MTSLRIAAVVVAWNRADMLRDTLDALAGQTRPLDDIIVVDNASEDSTPELIRTHPGVTDIITMRENLGGAGGFAAGMARAAGCGADLIWVMDDDTVPHVDALEELLRARTSYPGTPAILACRADWVDGREHPMNRPRSRFLVSSGLRNHASSVGAQQIRTASFVAIMVDVRAIREEGLPMAAYFLWNDDFEFTARLLRHRVGLYVDRARVEHRTKVFGNSTANPGPRFFNEVRNKLWVFTRSRCLGPVERPAFILQTLRRWTTLVAKSSSRCEDLHYIAEGIREGMVAPRSTREILMGTPVADDVVAIEQGLARG